MFSPEHKYNIPKPLSGATGPGPEPMVMGSPSSPNQISMNASQSQYLPSFLLGDSTPTIPSTMQSHMSGSRVWPSGSGSLTRPAKSTSASLQPAQLFGSSKQSEDPPPTRSKDKLSAPPVIGLLDSSVHKHNSGIVGHHSAMNSMDMSPTNCPLGAGISSPGPLSPQSSQFLAQMSHSTPAVFNASTAGIPNQSLNSSQLDNHFSPAQIDPFYTQGEELSPHDILDETWVTVFGFPRGAAGHILQQFSEYGTILQHVVSNEGNWMHLHYQSKIPAKKALSKNGKVIGNNIMVGVSQCIDKAVMRGETPPNCDKDESVSLYSVNHSLPLRVKGMSDQQTPKSGTPIRSLTKAYDGTTSLTGKENNGDSQNDAWWKKAMEYAFGW